MNAETADTLDAACTILRPYVVHFFQQGVESVYVDWPQVPPARRELCTWAWECLCDAAPPPAVRVIPAAVRPWGLDKTPQVLTLAQFDAAVRRGAQLWWDGRAARAAAAAAEAARIDRAALLEARSKGLIAHLNLAPDAPSIESQMVRLRPKLKAIRAADAAFAAELAARQAAAKAARLAKKAARAAATNP